MTHASRRQIVVTVNGPGEVAAWLFPFAETLKRREPEARIVAVVLPCVFATGRESDVLALMPGVDAVVSSRAAMRFIYLGVRPPEITDGVPGCVLHFGGELWLSAGLARRLRYRLVMYAERLPAYRALIDEICLVDGDHAAAAEPRARVIGDLMVDAARMRVPARKPLGTVPLTVGLFPGSRSYMIKHQLPFLIKVAGDASRLERGIRWMVARSDFVPLDEMVRVAADATGRLLDGESARWDGGALRSERGVPIELATAPEVMAQADLAVTIPGTNTAELAALGVPMMLLFPTQHLHRHPLPLPGLVGQLFRVPLLRVPLKQVVARLYLRFRRYWAHPNRRAGEEIVPEIIGRFTTEEIARALVGMLRAPDPSLPDRLRTLMGPPGGTERLVRTVLRVAHRPSQGVFAELPGGVRPEW